LLVKSFFTLGINYNMLSVDRFAIIEGMIVVIIAGGSGTRLWPLSTPSYPKQLLKVNGESRSLLQNTFDRAKRLTETVYVMPESRLVEHVKEQLPELPEDRLIVEPALRGTASCVAAALALIGKNHDQTEPIAFLWADHYIRDVQGFAHSFRVAADVSAREKRIVLVGIEPDTPATGFGYIEKGELLDEQSFVFNVQAFKEKPTYDVARQYLKSGNYLWNAGYAVGSVETFTKSMQAHGPDLYDKFIQLQQASSSEEYARIYEGFESVAIEYALTEKVPDLLMVPASFDWLDLGSFGDLYKVADLDEQGNDVQGMVELEGVNNSLVHNQEDKPVVVIGLDNITVVNTPDGILVVPKDLSQKVGEVSKRLPKKG